MSGAGIRPIEPWTRLLGDNAAPEPRTVISRFGQRVRVQLLEPAVLDETAARLHPALVVCSQLSTTVRTHAGTRFLLYPDGPDRVAIGAGDWRQVLPPSDFAAAWRR